jgi:DNA-binding PucR family transcriptional regulator
MGLPYSQLQKAPALLTGSRASRRALRFAKQVVADTLRRPGEVIAAHASRTPVGAGPASSPEVLAELAQAALGTLNQLPDAERNVLITTLRAWVACGGSADATARALCCRPRTVRYRVNRALQGIEWTGPRHEAD